MHSHHYPFLISFDLQDGPLNIKSLRPTYCHMFGGGALIFFWGVINKSVLIVAGIIFVEYG